MSNATKNGRSYAGEIFYDEIPASFNQEVENTEIAVEPTTKVEVLEKIEAFSQQIQNDSDVISNTFLNSQDLISVDQDNMLKMLATAFPLQAINQGLRVNGEFNTKTRVLYLLDETKEDSEDSSGNELSSFFSSRASELFLKMNSAMKLSRSDISIFCLKHGGKEHKEMIFQLIHFLQPEVVLTFGATTTSHFYFERKRLSEVHGEIETKKLKLANGENYEFPLMPLFHPELLLVNGNMKKTAWLDMQKCMKLLGL